MFCKNCGQESTDSSRFCRYCGAELVPESAPVEETTAQQTEANTANYSAPIYNTAPVPTVDPGSGLGITAMILGIVGLSLGAICSCLFALLGGIIPLACAIVAVSLGVVGKKKSAAVGIENKRAKVGITLGIIAIAVIIVFIILNGILGALMGASIAAKYDSYY